MALRVACCTSTFPATTVIAATRTSGARKAMISATASSEAVSVSMRNVRGTGVRITDQRRPPGRLCLWPTSKKCTVTRFPKGEPDVHAAESDNRAVDDDHQRRLLGFLGKHIQGCQELSFRTLLLGLRGWHFFDLTDPRLHHGKQRSRLFELSK